MTLCVAVGCSSPQHTPSTARATQSKRPTRVVSLDYCADQFVLKLADRRNIAALSPDATRDFSYLRDEAVGLPSVRSTAESVLALDPDLIVLSYGGGPGAEAFFKQAGIRVHKIGYAEDFDGVRANVRDAAKAMGQIKEGEAVVADFDGRMAKLQPARDVSALYITRAGVTTGPGSMIDLMMTTAGLTNFQTKTGWNALPLERLASQRPDMAAAAFFGSHDSYQDYWSAARHPIARALVTELPVAELDGSTTACGGWFVMDAIEVLAAKGRQVSAQRAVKS